jgi:hypothetical protein
MAIHHALLGLLSIQADNRLGHTALSAGWDSFASGLLEAVACLAERPDQPVMLIHADQAMPEGYECFAEADDAMLPLVMAVALGRPGLEGADGFTLQVLPAPDGIAPSPSMAIDFLRFILGREPMARSVGRRMQWVCHRAA